MAAPAAAHCPCSRSGRATPRQVRAPTTQQTLLGRCLPWPYVSRTRRRPRRAILAPPAMQVAPASLRANSNWNSTSRSPSRCAPCLGTLRIRFFDPKRLTSSLRSRASNCSLRTSPPAERGGLANAWAHPPGRVQPLLLTDAAKSWCQITMPVKTGGVQYVVAFGGERHEKVHSP